MRKTLIFITSKFFKPFINYYVSKPTNYRYNNANIVVFPNVFHPRFFFSTKLLLKTMKKLDLKAKSFLELGAGSGLISIVAAQRGASVMATDISGIAIANIKQNQKLNNIFFPVIHSDLFENISRQAFDFIVINPPYYKKNPTYDADHAWYCGENSEYFVRLFATIKNFFHAKSAVLMVLSDVCDIELIKGIAIRNGLKLKLHTERQMLLEKNYVYEILKT